MPSDWAGGDLLQKWIFQACKIGRFKIILQRYEEQCVVEISVTTSSKWFNGNFSSSVKLKVEYNF